MSVSGSKVTAPVGLGEVASLLGESSDLKTVCMSSKINSNAKYKPIRWNKYTVHNTDGSLINIVGTDGVSRKYWQAQDGLCGFQIPATNQIISAQSEDGVWNYLPPVGGDVSPFRLEDFAGYYHNAPWNWGLPSALSSIVVGGSVYRIGFNVNLQNDNSLCYADIFTPSNSEENTGIFVHFSNLNAGTAGLEKQILIDWSTGKYTLELDAAEIRSIALTAGSKMRVHFYGKIKGRIVSLRNSSNTVTFFSVSVLTSQPYVLDLRGAFLHQTGSYNYAIYNLTAVVDARSGQGGTLAAGSKVRVYEEVSGLADNQYNSLYSPLWESGTIGAITVSQGSSTNALYQNGYTKLTSYNDIAAVKVIWVTSANVVLASVRIATQNTSMSLA